MTTSRRRFKQIRTIGTTSALREYLGEHNVDLPLDDDVVPGPDGPLAQPIRIGALAAANRFAILPMEGWDATPRGLPTNSLERRWKRFGASGAGLVWGEATAVAEDGRANPNQLIISAQTVDSLASLRSATVDERAARYDGPRLIVGMQLTHSGRWARPHGNPLPRIAQRNALLDEKVPVTDASVISDDELESLALRYIEAGELAADAGFDFVDIKHCHGYLLHELLSARDRGGRFGGSFEGRTRFLRLVVQELQQRRPNLTVAVRLSAIDPGPFRADSDGVGGPVVGKFRSFGSDENGDPLGETNRFLSLCVELGVELVSVTIGSPYYNPHVQRPAYHPALDGYLPPREPLAEVALHLATTATLAKDHPDLVLVGSGYSYLQEFLINAAQYQVRTGGVGMVGLGRLALSYPHYPADILGGHALNPRLLCRTFSDCTTAPRIGLPSGCYPLDEYYKKSDVRVEIAAAKKRKKKRAQGA